VNGTYTEKDETDPVGAINRMLAYAAHLAESPEANPKIASLHKQIAALTAELADWKAGRYIAVVPGPEHGGVSHGVMVPPIRVPFSDEVIEKMAEAACDSIGYTLLYENSTQPARDQWQKGIRAALAAGGIEPCAVPEYAPEDVAFPISHTIERNMQLEKECERLTDRMALVSAKSNRRRVALKALNRTVASQSDLIQRFLRAGKEPVPPAHVAEPLAAEIAEHRRHVGTIMSREAELKRQLEAVTAERDENAADLSRLQSIALVPDEAGEQLAALRQPVDADMWKTPLDIESMIIETHKMRAFYYEDGFRFAIWNDGSRVNCTISPADAARVAVHLASYADAHGCPVSGAIQYKRNPANDGFVDMPTDAQIEKMAEAACNAAGISNDWNHTDYGDEWRKAVRAALAAGGRVPVGWELDVTEQAIRNAWLDAEAGGGNTWNAAKAVLDLCRSRIKPVYECKECIQWRNANNELVRRADAARAALEGE